MYAQVQLLSPSIHNPIMVSARLREPAVCARTQVVPSFSRRRFLAICAAAMLAGIPSSQAQRITRDESIEFSIPGKSGDTGFPEQYHAVEVTPKNSMFLNGTPIRVNVRINSPSPSQRSGTVVHEVQVLKTLTGKEGWYSRNSARVYLNRYSDMIAGSVVAQILKNDFPRSNYSITRQRGSPPIFRITESPGNESSSGTASFTNPENPRGFTRALKDSWRFLEYGVIILGVSLGLAWLVNLAGNFLAESTAGGKD